MLVSPPSMVLCSANFLVNEDKTVVMEIDATIQLKAWKDLAISKQILMLATTKALGLTPECSTEELQSALDQAIKRTNEADIKVADMRAQTDNELAAMKALVKGSEAALAEAQERVVEITNARAEIETQLAIRKSEYAKALQEAKAEVADSHKRVKAISSVLADTPENVIKKLKTLKKQRLDDARIREQIEIKLRTTSKEKSDLEKKVETQSARLEATAPLLEKLREMHDSCTQANKNSELLSDDNKDRIELPTLDEELLEVLGKALSDLETDTGA
jgi:hypothetical protein